MEKQNFKTYEIKSLGPNRVLLQICAESLSVFKEKAKEALNKLIHGEELKINLEKDATKGQVTAGSRVWGSIEVLNDKKEKDDQSKSGHQSTDKITKHGKQKDPNKQTTESQQGDEECNQDAHQPIEDVSTDSPNFVEHKQL